MKQKIYTKYNTKHKIQQNIYKIAYNYNTTNVCFTKIILNQNKIEHTWFNSGKSFLPGDEKFNQDGQRLIGFACNHLNTHEWRHWNQNKNNKEWIM